MVVLGFDPGGFKGFGCCVLRSASFSTNTVSSIAEAFEWAIAECGDEYPVAGGIDTLLHWSDGPSGWRRADRHLKATYPAAASSVMSPNSLFGAMAVGGVGLAIRLRDRWPKIMLTETHPKVLFHALHGSSYAKSDITVAFDWFISMAALSSGTIRTEHELDALLSAWAAREGSNNDWQDLCQPKTADMLFPAGPVSYFWPREEMCITRGT